MTWHSQREKTLSRKIIVLGADGMLGHKLCERLAADGREVVATFHCSAKPYAAMADIFGGVRCVGDVAAMDHAALARFLDAERPAAVVNCVGIVKQLDAVNNRRVTVGVNSYFPHVLEQLCGTMDARLIHFSTDCVFSGRKGAYVETDVSDAEDMYGRSKYLGETGGTEGASVTLRKSVIGRELGRHTHGLVEWLFAQKGKRIRGYTRAIYSGFTTAEMATIVGLAIDRAEPLRGLYHVASAPISKFDLLKLIATMAGLDIEIERDETFACDRSLVMDRFVAATGYKAPSWEQMIGEMLADPVPYDRYRGMDNA
jgi:dTDP-4-dehydrorhamnose reductase